MATGNQATMNIQISWLEMGMMPGREVPPREDNSTMATLVGKYIRISWRELVYELVRKHIRISVWETVYESVSLRGMEYEYVSWLEMGMKLGMEVPWMERQSTRATLVENYIRISWRELVYEAKSRAR
jgi:hypothetical protein